MKIGIFELAPRGHPPLVEAVAQIYASVPEHEIWIITHEQAANNLKSFPIALAYTMAIIGTIAGGSLPIYFIQNGKSVFAARKTAMFIYAIC